MARIAARREKMSETRPSFGGLRRFRSSRLSIITGMLVLCFEGSVRLMDSSLVEYVFRV